MLDKVEIKKRHAFLDVCGLWKYQVKYLMNGEECVFTFASKIEFSNKEIIDILKQ